MTIWSIVLLHGVAMCYGLVLNGMVWYGRRMVWYRVMVYRLWSSMTVWSLRHTVPKLMFMFSLFYFRFAAEMSR